MSLEGGLLFERISSSAMHLIGVIAAFLLGIVLQAYLLPISRRLVRGWSRLTCVGLSDTIREQRLARLDFEPRRSDRRRVVARLLAATHRHPCIDTDPSWCDRRLSVAV